MTREEIDQKMNELACKYVETHDPEIIKELYQLSRQLERMKKG
jgi:FKBP-type peptidyl-prolyl cis-trans isomerase (trigger factor)